MLWTLRICRNAWTRYGNCPDRPLPVLPLFDDGGEVRDCYLPLCRRVQAPPVPAEQEQQRSGTERAASPGNGAVHRVWGTAPTSRNCGFRQRREPQFRAFVGTKALLATMVTPPQKRGEIALCGGPHPSYNGREPD